MYRCQVDQCNKEFATEKILQKHYYQSKDLDHRKILYNDLNKDEWVECKVSECNYRGKTLRNHVKDHGLTIEQYKELYGNESHMAQVYIEKSRKGGFKAIEKATTRVYKDHPCEICKKNIVKSQKKICVQCKLKKARDNQEAKFVGLKENVDFIRCQVKLEDGSICNWPDTRISRHIAHHGYTKQQYKKEFPEYNLVCNKTKDKTAFRGKHSEKTKKKMAASHKDQIPWNHGLTKYDHPGIASIANKNAIRMSQLHNNTWHTNPFKKV